MSEQKITRLGFLQFAVKQGDIQANLERVRKGLSDLNPPAGSLIALPEMWATGFVYESLEMLSAEIPSLLEELEKLARSYNIILAGSLPCRQVVDGTVRLTNRLYFSGSKQQPVPGIDKQHLFSFWKEDLWFKAGSQPKPVPLAADATIGGLVCYDRSFSTAAKAHLYPNLWNWPIGREEQCADCLKNLRGIVDNYCVTDIVCDSPSLR